ncbi:MAG: TolC family protein [Gemmatimonadota bacterium]
MPRIFQFLLALLPFFSLGAAAQGPSPVGARVGTAATTHSRPDTLTLLDVLSRARDAHPQGQAALARIAAARGSRRTAGNFVNPVFQYQVENTPIPGRGAVSMDREAMTMLMVPLEPFYQRGPRIARADADVRAVEADARTASIRLELDAAHAFYRASMAQVAFNVTRDLSAWLDSVVVYNQSRVKEGIASEADLIRARLEADRVSADMSMQEADLAREQATLSSFVGTSTTAPFVLAITHRPLQWRLAESLDARIEPAVALAEHTPSVRAARERVSSSAAGLALERRMLIRDLSATLGTKQTGGFTSLIAGVTLPIPLFTQNGGEIARATAEQRVAEFELATAQRAASAELQGALDAATVLLRRTTVLAAPQSGDSVAMPAVLARADESRRIALGAYREGAVPLLSVLDAARVWGEVRIAFYRALFTQHESVLALAAALGTPPDQVLSSPMPTLQVPR